MIAIIDYGMGNLGSILNMLKKIRVEAVISSDRSIIAQASGMILPGVGSFDRGMANLAAMELIPVLKQVAMEQKTPILGICLGMQLFTKKSEEGSLPGLGFIDAETVKFEFDSVAEKLKVPHMGWNTVKLAKDHMVYEGMFEKEPRFYFVHSYHVKCHHDANVLTTTNYGYDFVSSFFDGNILGVQFHPEKSHKFGMSLLGNFAKICHG